MCDLIFEVAVGGKGIFQEVSLIDEVRNCILFENEILPTQDSSPSFLCSPSLAGLGAQGQERERLWCSLCHCHSNFWESAFITEISAISLAIRHGLLFHSYRAEMGEMEARALESRSAHTKSFHPLISDMTFLSSWKWMTTPLPQTTVVQGSLAWLSVVAW